MIFFSHQHPGDIRRHPFFSFTYISRVRRSLATRVFLPGPLNRGHTQGSLPEAAHSLPCAVLTDIFIETTYPHLIPGKVTQPFTRWYHGITVTLPETLKAAIATEQQLLRFPRFRRHSPSNAHLTI